jgi:NAD(P)-dependent dehydrogenase (short-subunit alcohol dehydrogenase family)
LDIEPNIKPKIAAAIRHNRSSCLDHRHSQGDRAGVYRARQHGAAGAGAVRNAATPARIPAGRWGEAADFAGAVVFLASAASDYVSGTVLTVDGGWMGR